MGNPKQFTNVGIQTNNDIIKDNRKYSSNSINLKTVDAIYQQLPSFTNKFPNDDTPYGCIVIHKGVLHVFCDGSSNKSHYILSNNQWVRLNDLPQDSSSDPTLVKPYALSMGDSTNTTYKDILVFNVFNYAGSSGSGNECWRWNPTDDSWTKVFDLPAVSPVGGMHPLIYMSPGEDFMGHTIFGACYMFGGQANPKKVWRKQSSSWTELDIELPGNLYWGYGGVCYLDEGDPNDIYIHILATNTHSKIKCNRNNGVIRSGESLITLNNIAPVSTTHYDVLKCINNKLYAFNFRLNAVKVWDKDTDTWSTAFDLPYTEAGDIDMDNNMVGYELGSLDNQEKTRLGYKFTPTYSLDII